MNDHQPNEAQKQWLEKIDAEDDAAYFRRTYNAELTDLRPEIRQKEFWERCQLSPSDEDMAGINFILNVYLADSANNRETLLRPKRDAAPALLTKASNALANAVEALKGLETNPYASSAVISQLSTALPETADEDQRICVLNRFSRNVNFLSKILASAASQRNYSDGLSKPLAGRPIDPYLDVAILKLATLLERIIRASHEANMRKPLQDNARELSTSAIARHIAPLLLIVRVGVEAKSIEERLRRLKGYFPANYPQ